MFKVEVMLYLLSSFQNQQHRPRLSETEIEILQPYTFHATMPEPVIFLNSEVLFIPNLLYSLQDKLSTHSTLSLKCNFCVDQSEYRIHLLKF